MYKNLNKKFVDILLSGFSIIIFRRTILYHWKSNCNRNLKGLFRKNKRGYRLKPKHFRSWSQLIWVLSYVSVSRKLIQNCVKVIPKLIYIWIWYRNFHQWQCSIIVTWWKCWSHDIGVSIIGAFLSCLGSSGLSYFQIRCVFAD